MSTNSLIGYKRPDGKVEYIYCHWDGYLEHNGQVLAEHYTDFNKVKELIGLGSLSCLESVIGEKHDFSTHQQKHPDWCCAYMRDRNDEVEHCCSQICTENEFWAKNEWLYLFDGDWKFRQPIKTVKYALQDLERSKIVQ